MGAIRIPAGEKVSGVVDAVVPLTGNHQNESGGKAVSEIRSYTAPTMTACARSCTPSVRES